MEHLIKAGMTFIFFTTFSAMSVTTMAQDGADQAVQEAQSIEELSGEKEGDAADAPMITPSAERNAHGGLVDRHPAQTGAAAEPVRSEHVARATFALQVIDREPVDEVGIISADQVYYFTELRGLEGQMVWHRWQHQGEVMADVEFQVGGPHWRVWSKKRLSPRWTGEWTVSVIDERGRVLRSDTIQYSPGTP